MRVGVGTRALSNEGGHGDLIANGDCTSLSCSKLALTLYSAAASLSGGTHSAFTLHYAFTFALCIYFDVTPW